MDRSLGNTIFCVMLFVLNVSLGVWALYVRDNISERCDRPLDKILLGLGVIFIMGAVLIFCTHCHTRYTYESFLETGPIIRQRMEQAAKQGDPQLPSGFVPGAAITDPTRRRLGAESDVAVDVAREETKGLLDDKSEDSQGKDKEAEKIVAVTITDHLLMSCCSCTYYMCAILAAIILTGVLAAYIFHDTGNCESQAPNLLEHCKNLFIAFVCTLILHGMWFYRGFFDCGYMWDVHYLQQRVVKQMDKHNKRRIRLA